MTASTQVAHGKFWDRIADRYAAKPVANEAAYQEKLRVTREYLRPDMELLELGCGTGSTALVHAPHVRHIRAVDISARMIEIAQRKAEAQNIQNVTFERQSIDSLGVSEPTYDAVLGLSILHLLPDRDQAIAAVYRMLQPGGIFVTSTACLGSMRYVFFRALLPIGRLLGLVPLVRFFSASQLVTSLKDAGFEIDHQWQPAPHTAFIVATKPA